MFLGNKRGMQNAVLVTMIVVIVSAVAVFWVGKLLAQHVVEAEKDRACEVSIHVAAQTKKFPSFEGSPGTGRSYTPLKCDRGEILLKYTDVVRDGVIDQERAHQILAEEMHHCWKKVGAGKIDPFSNWDTEGESYCLLCDEVRFDQKLLDFINDHAVDIAKGEAAKYMITSPDYYLMTHEVPNMKGISYWEYLYNQKPRLTEQDLQELRKQNRLVLPGTVTVVSMYKPKDKEELGYKLGIYGGGAFILLGIGIALIPLTGGISVILSGAGFAALGAAGGSFVLGGYMAYSTFTSAFKDCPKCQGLGALSFVYPDEAFSKEITVGEGNNAKRVKLCTRLVN